MSLRKNDVAVIIPNWNGRDLIGPCLDSLRDQTKKHTIIVVDNGSTDDSVAYIKKQYPEVVLIELPVNTGFTGGVNTGISYALDNDYVFVALFNDDALAHKNWLEQLTKAMSKNPEIGIVTGKFMRLDKKHLDSTGDFLTVWGLPFPRGRNEVDKNQYDKQVSIFGATGGASLYRSAMLGEIGLFDDDFFAYYEDVDISFRAQLAGWKVRYEPHAIAYHHVSATSSKMGDLARFHSTKNFLLLYTKNMPGILFLKYFPLFCITFFRMMLSSFLRKKPLVFMHATFCALKLSPSVIKHRRHIQKNRKASIKYIDSILTHSRPKRFPRLEGEK